MKKYNLSEIMKNAWNLYRMAQKWVDKKSFSWALKSAWAKAKEAVKEAAEEAAKAASGIRRMHYSEYKRDFAGCKTVDGSYDKRTKTIEVITTAVRPARIRFNGLCPRCHTYCYGDCMA